MEKLAKTQFPEETNLLIEEFSPPIDHSRWTTLWSSLKRGWCN